MRIAFETDKWINMYSTATVLSKSDNTVAFQVVANSTTTPTYQLVVTTQGNVGIGTASPAGLFTVGNGTLTVLSNGNVGVGTASPAVTLDVRGGIRTNWSASTVQILTPNAWNTITHNLGNFNPNEAIIIAVNGDYGANAFYIGGVQYISANSFRFYAIGGSSGRARINWLILSP